MNIYNKDLLIKPFMKTIIRSLIIGPIKDTIRHTLGAQFRGPQLKAHITGPY